MSHQTRNGKQTAILACLVDSGTKKKTDSKTSKKDIVFQIYRPNTGLQFRHESLAEIDKKYKKVQSDEAESHWTQQYDASVNTCSHAYWRGNCRNVSMGQECEVSFLIILFFGFREIFYICARSELVFIEKSSSTWTIIIFK